MKIKLLFLIILSACGSSFAQSKLWLPVSEISVTTAPKMERTSMPKNYKLYYLDYVSLKMAVANAPLDTQGQQSNLIVDFPSPNGTINRYRIFESPIMEKGLENKFPGLKSYSGKSLSNPAETIRFSLTRFGLHSMAMNSDFGTYYIDTYTKDLNTYIVYAKQSLAGNSTFTCQVQDNFSPAPALPNANLQRASDSAFRVYRLAMACTIEYAAFHVNAAGLNAGTLAEKKAAVLSAMVVSMTRINGVFENDMSLRMNLVANNDLVIFIDTDAFDNTNANTLINQSQTVIDANIGLANYDIGHTVSTGGGGLAQLNSPCSNSKARGITGSGGPVGDAFDIDYVAHEMGHQYGATHTQNNNCNRSAGTAVEPGSGSTIMAYAGICSPNVQSNSDAHFHAVSIAQMSGFVAGSGNCSANTPNGNFPPVVSAGIDYTIPKGTAFILKGSATDANDDSLTYCWEQTNTEVSIQPPLATATSGPNFRSNPPSILPNRFMPPLASVVANNLAPTWEVVSTVARTMNFALTVRDNRTPNGGQTGRDDMVINVANVGPFLVSTPNTAVAYVAGSNQTVSWDVAGTTANGINCANVDIFLSTDGGLTFPTLLASNVPNDGAETITIPNTLGTTNRIMVSGKNHIFYDVSNTNFSITTPSSDFTLAFSGIENGQNKEVCQGGSVSYAINYSTLSGFSGMTAFSVSGNPAGSLVTFSPTTATTAGTITVTVSNTEFCLAGFYPMSITGISGATTKTVNLYLTLLNATFATMVLTSPADLAFAQATNLTLTWTADAAATLYTVQVATDADFTNTFQNQTVATNSYLVTGLNGLSNYFWRVLPRNTGCLGTYSAPSRFTTGQTLCTTTTSTNIPIAISGSGTPTINSTLTIPPGSNVTIADINITAQVTHTWAADLSITLISPTGIEVQLISAQCGSADNLNATFDDAGTTLICGTNPAIVGTIAPAQPLSAFNGLDSQGVWTLRITDLEAGDGGSLTAWSLNICSVPNVAITCGQITSVWNGTAWSNGRPLENVAAIINGNFTATEDLYACSLAITGNSQVILNSGSNFTIDGAITVDPTANLTVQNNANIIQIQDVINTGITTINRETNLLRRLDYTIWSSPVTGAQTLKQFSPNTLNNRFYSYNTSGNVYFAVANPVTQPFELATSYLIRMPDNHPSTPTLWNGQFTGNLNNGNIEASLTYVGTGQSFNMIGNPYPSTISAEDFINDNSATIFGTLYFWRKINNAAGTAYATYTLGGATTTSPTSPTPNGMLQVGQGFLVEAKNVASPTANFTNTQRINNNQNQFFRNVNAIEKHRIWLNITNEANLFAQMMVGYMETATDGVDDTLDGKYVNDSPIALNSIIINDDYAIQLKSLPFETTDVVPLRFKTDVAGAYAISIDHVDGIFENDNQLIFIRDNALQTVHSLSDGTYNFSSEAGTFDTRFDLIYENAALGIDSLSDNPNSVIAYSTNEIIQVKSNGSPLSKIVVYDTLGRKLYVIKNCNSNTISLPFLNATNQMLLLDITLENGLKTVRKVMQ